MTGKGGPLGFGFFADDPRDSEAAKVHREAVRSLRDLAEQLHEIADVLEAVADSVERGDMTGVLAYEELAPTPAAIHRRAEMLESNRQSFIGAS